MNEIIEEWRPVVGYEGLYEASNLGRIKSYKRNPKGYILKPIVDAYGYTNVTLSDINHKPKPHRVHNIIAQTFPDICGEWFEGCEADHINTIRTDNRASNLKVCTVLENNNNPLTRKHRSLARMGFKYTEESRVKMSISAKKRGCNDPKRKKAIIQFLKNDPYPIAWFDSIMDCEHFTGIDNRNIAAVLHNRRKSAYGFTFKYDK